MVERSDTADRVNEAAALLLGGKTVRFNHERESGPDYHITGVSTWGMIELEELPGTFAPHLFVHPA